MIFEMTQMMNGKTIIDGMRVPHLSTYGSATMDEAINMLQIIKDVSQAKDKVDDAVSHGYQSGKQRW